MQRPRTSTKANFSRAENEHLRRVLLQLRADRGWTQTQAGKALGVTQARISGLETGTGGGFGGDIARSIARELGMTFPALMGWIATEEPPPSNEPYPNRSVAVRAGRLLRLSEDAIAALVAKALDEGSADPPPRWWMRRLLELDDALRGPRLR